MAGRKDVLGDFPKLLKQQVKPVRPEKAGDFFECAGNAIASRTSPLRSTSVMYSDPQISQLIDDR